MAGKRVMSFLPSRATKKSFLSFRITPFETTQGEKRTGHGFFSGDEVNRYINGSPGRGKTRKKTQNFKTGDIIAVSECLFHQQIGVAVVPVAATTFIVAWVKTTLLLVAHSLQNAASNVPARDSGPDAARLLIRYHQFSYY